MEISVSTVFQQTHWSVGHCSRCARYEAIRVGDFVEVVSLYELFPINRRVMNEASLCDWCGSPAEPAPEARVIPSGRWASVQGLESLFAICAPDLLPQAPRLTSDDAICSLLSFVQRRSSLTAVSISVGIIIGALLLAAVGAIAGALLPIQIGPDGFATVFALALAGVVVGAIVGGLIEAVIRRRQVARRLIWAAYHKYQLPSDRLMELAATGPRRIRGAVRAVLRQVR